MINERIRKKLKMKAKVIGRSLKISPRKLSLIADSMRGKSAIDALNDLSLIRKRGADIVIRTLESAMANAVNNLNLKKENLCIKRMEVNQGQSLKRYHPSTRGRVHPYKKKRSHLLIVLEEKGGINKILSSKS